MSSKSNIYEASKIIFTLGVTFFALTPGIKQEISLEVMIVKQALTFYGCTIRVSGMEKDIMIRRVEGT